MKVLIINSTCGYGSTGKIVVNLHNEIKKHGDDCCIAYGRGKADEQINAYKIGSRIDVLIHGLFNRITDKHGLYSRRATRRLIKKIKEYKPDVIHLHNIHGYYLNYEILFSYLKENGVPVVWTLHDCWTYTGHCAYYDFCGCDKWKSGCEKCEQKKTYPSSFVLSNSKSNFVKKKNAFCGHSNLTLVTPSMWLEKEVKKSYLKDYDVQVIYNGIELDIYNPESIQIDKLNSKYALEDKFVILGVANMWEERKGLFMLEKIADLATPNWQVVVVGDIGDRDKHNNILYIQRTDSSEEVAELYVRANVFVNPTFEDNFPTTNIEALASGTPVITFETGGSPEAIDGESGYCVEKGNFEQLVGCLRNVESGALNGQKCVERSKLFSKEQSYEAYYQLYVKVEKKDGIIC